MLYIVLAIINILFVSLQAIIESKINKWHHKPFKYYYTAQYMAFSTIIWFIILLLPKLLPI